MGLFLGCIMGSCVHIVLHCALLCNKSDGMAATAIVSTRVEFCPCTRLVQRGLRMARVCWVFVQQGHGSLLHLPGLHMHCHTALLVACWFAFTRDLRCGACCLLCLHTSSASRPLCGCCVMFPLCVQSCMGQEAGTGTGSATLRGGSLCWPMLCCSMLMCHSARRVIMAVVHTSAVQCLHW